MDDLGTPRGSQSSKKASLASFTMSTKVGRWASLASAVFCGQAETFRFCPDTGDVMEGHPGQDVQEAT